MKGRSLAWPALLAVALFGYAVLLFDRYSHTVGGSDSSGYANTARLLAQGRVTAPIEPLERFSLPLRFADVFIPLAFVPGTEPGTMAPFYPVGMPLHMVLVASLLGWSNGPYFVSPLAALGSLVIVYLLGRELKLPRGLSLAGAAILGACPVFLSHALQSMSDVLATFWCAAAVLAALRARRHTGWSAVAGLAFGIAVLVRPTNVLVLPAVILALPLRPASLLLFLAGGVPPAGMLLAYNAAAYGNPFQIGYVRTGLLDAFARAHFPVRFRNYGYWLAIQLSPLAPLGWLALPANRRAPLYQRALLFVWLAAFFLFYCFYEPNGTWMATRFLLPAIPALILGALLSVRDFLRVESARPLGRVLAAAFVAVALAFGIHQSDKLRVLKTAREQDIIPEACRRAAVLFPPGSLVIAEELSGALCYYTTLTPVRWDRLDPASFSDLRARTEGAGGKWFALMIDMEVPLAAPLLPGEWKFLERRKSITFWELAPMPPGGASGS